MIILKFILQAMSKILKNTNFFTILTKFLIIILPFYVIIKVYFKELVWFWFFGFFIKEFVVILLFCTLIYEFWKNKKRPKFDYLDYLIFLFFAYWIIITFLNSWWLKEIFYWWRYDFLGFFVFLIYKHWKIFLKEKLKNLINLFFISSLISIFFGLIVKFILWEEILVLFGFSDKVAEFGFGWGIPIYQWVEASQIRRFQGILDSPLAMWYLLLLFVGLYYYINRKNYDYAFFLGLFFLCYLIFITYSRAAFLGFLCMSIFIFILNFRKKIWQKSKKVLFASFIWIIIFVWGFAYIFQDKIYNVVMRKSSTTGHFSRMEVGIKRFITKPMGSWLASAWPAYRSVINKKTSLELDRYYIPESWFIQILVEGWIVYFSLFLLILFSILRNFYKNNNYYIFSMFVWVLIMALFLHIFEYTYITILLFMFLALFYNKKIS